MWIKHPHWASRLPRSLVQGPFFRHGIRRALRRSDRIAAVSAATKAEIASIDAEAGERTRVTLSGVSPAFRRLPPEQVSVPEALRGRPYVLTVGQYSPYKNHEAALRAFAAAFAGSPEVQMAFVQRLGRGDRALLPLAAQLGLEGRVHFLPRLSQEQLVAGYNGATALLHPSFYEGFGNPLAEAMACGCPVVTSNVSAMPEVTAGAALLGDPGDFMSFAYALRRVFEDSGLAGDLRRRGLARAAELSWSRFAAQNLAVYRELL
jgi:glycosyltransferase involved in cell wall biosynthesis